MIDIEQIRAEFEAVFIAEYAADLPRMDFADAARVIQAVALSRDNDGEYTKVVPRERFRGWVQSRQALAGQLQGPQSSAI